ncbi:unnamed protein product [Symbiodinium sp. CCMP2592]|nr:unnamed protein product [Symbiodinium sp. CCMP2592]
MKNILKKASVSFGALDRFTKKAGDRARWMLNVLRALLFRSRPKARSAMAQRHVLGFKSRCITPVHCQAPAVSSSQAPMDQDALFALSADLQSADGAEERPAMEQDAVEEQQFRPTGEDAVEQQVLPTGEDAIRMVERVVAGFRFEMDEAEYNGGTTIMQLCEGQSLRAALQALLTAGETAVAAIDSHDDMYRVTGFDDVKNVVFLAGGGGSEDLSEISTLYWDWGTTWAAEQAGFSDSVLRESRPLAQASEMEEPDAAAEPATEQAHAAGKPGDDVAAPATEQVAADLTEAMASADDAQAAVSAWADVQSAAALGADAVAEQFSSYMCRRFDTDARRDEELRAMMDRAGTEDWRCVAAWSLLCSADGELAVHLQQFCNSRAQGSRTAALILQRLMKASGAKQWQNISLHTARTLAGVLPSLIRDSDEESDEGARRGIKRTAEEAEIVEGPKVTEEIAEEASVAEGPKVPEEIAEEASIAEGSNMPEEIASVAEPIGEVGAGDAVDDDERDAKVEEAMECELREHRKAIDELLSCADFMKDEQMEDDHLAEDVSTSPTAFVLFDHVNATAMNLLASKELSKIHRLGRTGPTVERALGDILVQCSKNVLPGGARTYKTIYHEEQLMADLKVKGRRHPGKPSKEEVADLRLVDPGVCSGHLAASTFVFPRWFRNLCWAGLKDHYTFDLANAHVCILAERHDSEFLREFILNRQAHLQSTHSERWIAKQLFLRLLYGGTVQAWKRAHGVDTMSSEAFSYAERFAAEVDKLRDLDVERNKELWEALRSLSPRPEDLLSYVLNTRRERQLIDRAEMMIKTHGGTVLAYEHDGLYLHVRPGRKAELMSALDNGLDGFKYTLEPQLSVEEAFEEARREMVDAGGHSSETRALFMAEDPQWREHHKFVMTAFKSPRGHHGLFAQVALRSPAVHSLVPHRIQEVFKIVQDTGHCAWYNAPKRVWILGGTMAMDVLKWMVQVVCQRDLSDYVVRWDTESQVDLDVDAAWGFSNETFRTSVANAMKSFLGVHSTDWELDGDKTRRYLNFQGRLFDRGSIDMHPDHCITRSTDWAHEWPAWWGSDAQDRLEAALREVRKQHDAFRASKQSGPCDLDEKACEMLELAACAIRELAVLHRWTENDWGATVLELELIAKGVFAMPQAAGMWLRGVGRNGKDTLANIMECILGSYSCSIDFDSLLRVADPNKPSPVWAMCRARRFVAIREVDGVEQIRLQVYKRMTDPNSQMMGRDLYEKLVRYKPQFVAFFASNHAPPLTSEFSVKERSYIIEHVSVFKDVPTESNERKWEPIEDTLQRDRPSYFAILFLIYKHLLHGVKMRSIGPVPTSSHNLSVMELKDATKELVRKFIKERLIKAQGTAKATVRDEIYEELSEVLNNSPEILADAHQKRRKLNPADLLKAEGFVEKKGKGPADSKGKRPNVNLIYYRFADSNGVKALDDSPAHLLPASAARTSVIASALGAVSS